MGVLHFKQHEKYLDDNIEEGGDVSRVLPNGVKTSINLLKTFVFVPVIFFG